MSPKSIGLEAVEPTLGLIAWAESTRAELEDTKKRREAHIQAMYDQLEALWRRLGVTDNEMDAFVEAQRGSTEVTVRAYEEELERMLELKRERMGTFVENARTEITKLWDKLMIGEEERADFAPFADDEHTEELLVIHEKEIKRLKKELEDKDDLLEKIRTYFGICEEEKALAEAESDQSRLLSRGPRDPGRLLREEQMRKRVKGKPKLERQLLTLVLEWEKKTERTFFVHGQSILQLLEETVGIADKENNQKRSKAPGARGGSVPPRSKTPSNPSSQYAPGSSHGGKSNVATPAVRPGSSIGASSQSVPTKRARLGESTSSYTNATVPPVPTLGSSKGPGAHRAPSPTKIPGKTPTIGSSLPRPVVAMPASRSGTSHHGLGYGRAPSSHVPHAHSYHPYPASHRAASHASATLRHTSATLYPTLAAKKASRARRESFRPRASMDDNRTLGAGRPDTGGQRRWAGFAGVAVKEEEEDF